MNRKKKEKGQIILDGGYLAQYYDNTAQSWPSDIARVLGKAYLLVPGSDCGTTELSPGLFERTKIVRIISLAAVDFFEWTDKVVLHLV